ncbi:MAG: XRE family transcriptional regulator [Gammaproteobacteria bacterium]
MKKQAQSHAAMRTGRDSTRRKQRQASKASRTIADPLLGMEFHIGQRLRELRSAKGLSLSELAAEAEISVGNLSQIERGLAVPTIRTFCLLSRALGVGAGGLLEPFAQLGGDDDPFIVRAASAKSIVFSRSGVVKRLASPTKPGKLQMLVVEVAPGSGSSNNKDYTHAGEECGIVLEGVIDIWLDGEKRTLGAGDSFRFESTRPHRFHNPGNAPAKVIWVTSPPLY